MPLHPRTRAADRRLSLPLPTSVQLLDPVPARACSSSSAARTRSRPDSGGVQREAYLWGVRCITLREETEWTDTVEAGWNTLVGVDPTHSQPALDAPPPARAAPDLRRWARRSADRRRRHRKLAGTEAEGQAVSLARAGAGAAA